MAFADCVCIYLKNSFVKASSLSAATRRLLCPYTLIASRSVAASVDWFALKLSEQGNTISGLPSA